MTFLFYDATAKPWFSTVWQRMATALLTAHQQANSKEPAPWNQNTELWRRQYSQTGTALLAYAVKFSQDQGYAGRVSLHASNDSALAFYGRVAENRIPKLFYDERMGVVGPTPHGTNNRQPSTHKLNSLEGVVTALDIDQGELMLKIDSQNQRVKGRFYVMLHPTLLESLGKRIKRFGRVSYKKDQVASVYIQQAEVLDSE